MVDKILKLALLTSPIAYCFGMPPVKFEIIYFHFCVLALFIASLLDTPKRENHIISKGIALFLSFCLLSTCIHTFQSYSIATLVNLFLFCIALNIIYRYMTNPKDYYKYIGIAVLINIIVFLSQRFFTFLPFDCMYLGGFFGTAPRLGNYLALVTPIVFSHLWFIIPVVCVMAYSLNPMGIFLVMAIRKIKFNKIILYSLVGILAVIFIYLMRNQIMTSIQFRLNSFIIPTLREIFKTPLIGHGLGAYYKEIGNDPYNSVMSFSYDTGLLGGVLISYGLWKIRKYFDWSIESLSLIGLILASMIDYPLEIPRLWMTIAFIIGAFFIKEEVKDVSQKQVA